MTSTITPTATHTVTVTPRFSDQLFAGTHLESKIVTPGSSTFRTLRIYFKSSAASGRIRAKVFNLQSDLIKELTVQNLGDQFLAEWDGRDSHNQVRQGIYLYQIEIDGRAYNGSFVVAK